MPCNSTCTPTGWSIYWLQLVRNVTGFVVFVATILGTAIFGIKVLGNINPWLILAFAAAVTFGVCHLFNKKICKLDSEFDTPPPIDLPYGAEEASQMIIDELQALKKGESVWGVTRYKSDYSEVELTTQVTAASFGWFIVFSAITTSQSQVILRIKFEQLDKHHCRATLAFHNNGGGNEARTAKERAIKRIQIAGQRETGYKFAA